MSKWSASNVLILNKSKFKAFCTPLTSHSKIPELLQEIPLLDKTVKKASHPFMYAWKTSSTESATITDVQAKKSNSKKSRNRNEVKQSNISPVITKLRNLNQGSHDNNEGGSGDRILGMIDRLHLVNILVVVSRWYGGTPLGPARFKCMSDVGIEALRNGGYLSIKPGKGWIDCTNIK